MSRLVSIRTEASQQIGLGHVMRCLTLAEALRDLGAVVEFITRAHPGNLNDHIERKGFKVHWLPVPTDSDSQQSLNRYEQWLGVKQTTDAEETRQSLDRLQPDWLIIDHYALDAVWEKLLRPYTKKIMVIDDLSNRHHDCDILLDQTFGRQKSDYRQWVPDFCRLLLGSENALLRPDFAGLRPLALQHRDTYRKINRIMVSMGSMDETNIIPRVLNALSLIEWKTPPVVDVVLSSGAPHLAALREIPIEYSLPMNVLTDVTNMAELMLESDLAIGSGGATSWERCCMALPTVLIVLAENQALISKNLGQVGATITLHEDMNLGNNIKQAIESLMQDKKQYMELSKRAACICDGAGATRVAQELLK